MSDETTTGGTKPISPLVRELLERIRAEADAAAIAAIKGRVPAWREAEGVPADAVLNLETQAWEWSASA